MIITAPPGWTVSIKTEYGGWTHENVVAFDEEIGFPLINDGRALSTPRGGDWTLNEPEADVTNAIPAEPGWYAVFASHLDDDEDWIERAPAVAWQASSNGCGGRGLVITRDGNNTAGPDAATADLASNTPFIGY